MLCLEKVGVIWVIRYSRVIRVIRVVRAVRVVGVFSLGLVSTSIYYEKFDEW